MNIDVDISTTVLETERMILRPWKETDIDDFFEYASVDGVGQAAGWKPHESKEESAQILQLFIEEKKTFAIVLKENNKVIGSIGLEKMYLDLGEPYTSRKGREIGYVLSKDYWGHGLMTEAVQEVIRYCFQNVGCDFLLVDHFEKNHRSQRVIEKCGFKFVKDCDRKSQIGEVRKTKLYVLER